MTDFLSLVIFFGSHYYMLTGCTLLLDVLPLSHFKPFIEKGSRDNFRHPLANEGLRFSALTVLESLQKGPTHRDV